MAPNMHSIPTWFCANQLRWHHLRANPRLPKQYDPGLATVPADASVPESKLPPAHGKAGRFSFLSRLIPNLKVCVKLGQYQGIKMERETGIEPATSSLGSWRSTAELLPPNILILPVIETSVQFRASRFLATLVAGAIRSARNHSCFLCRELRADSADS